jgi:hypothetical protein
MEIVLKMMCVYVIVVGLDQLAIFIIVNLNVSMGIVLVQIPASVIQDGMGPIVAWISMNVTILVYVIHQSAVTLKAHITVIVKLVIS